MTIMKKGVSHAFYDWDSKPRATQKVKNQTAVPRICVFNALKVTLEINKAISFEVLITSNRIFFPVNQMFSHAS